MPSNLGPNDYMHTQGIKYEHLDARGYITIPVLEFLCGREWGEAALAYVSALRPSNLRVITGEMTTDSCLGRVTVRVDKNMAICDIWQEVEVDLPEGIENGHHFSMIYD